MIKINLVPQEILAKETQRQQAVQAGVAAAALAVVVAAATVAHWRAALRLEKQLAQDNAKYDKLKKLVEEVDQLKANAKAVQTRLDAIDDIDKGRSLYPFFMSDLAKTTPPDVWYQSVGTTSGGGNQLGVSLSCSAFSPEGVTGLMRNLAGSGAFGAPVISGIAVGGAAVGGAAGGKTYTFSLQTSYKSKQL